MDSLSYKTGYIRKEDVQKDWVVVDADGKVLGRLASEVAKMIRGKHKPGFTPNVDCGDRVIVINADKIRLTGQKWTDKVYVRHTGHPGGQRFATPKIVKEKKGTSAIIETAIKGMLPKNRLGRAIIGNLFVYDGAEHPHTAQNPKVVNI